MEEKETNSLGSQLRTFGAIAALIILIVFVAENFERVQVDFLFAQTETRLAFALVGSAALGFVLGYFAPRRHG